MELSVGLIFPRRFEKRVRLEAISTSYSVYEKFPRGVPQTIATEYGVTRSKTENSRGPGETEEAIV